MISKKILKLASIALASVMFVNSFGTLTRATSYDRNAEATIASTKKDTNKSKIGWILGGCSAGAGVIALASYLIYRDITKIPSDYLYNKLSENQTINATADDWFNRLGGTEQDIENYKSFVLEFENGQIQSPVYIGAHSGKAISRFDELDADIPRYPLCFVPGAISKSDTYKEIFDRILKIHYGKNPDVGYTQSSDSVMYMIYYKFMVNRGKDINSPLDQIDEAKVYFIYCKFMKMINSKFGNDTQYPTYAADYLKDAKVTVKIDEETIQDNTTAEDMYDSVVFGIFMKGVFAAGACLFGIESLLPDLIRIWDSIIMDDNFVSPDTGEFNADAVINNLNVTIYNMLCDPDEKNDELRKNVNPGTEITCSGGNTLTVSTK